MKKIFSLCLMLSLALAMQAVPAKRGNWKKIKLTDGTEVKAQLVGDEFAHFYQSEDGTRYQMDATTGEFRVMGESAFSTLRSKAMARRSKMQTRRVAKRKAASADNIFQGTKKALVILAEFTDSKFANGHNLALYKQIVNGENYTDNGFVGSVRDYFKAQSAGQFELDFDVVGICPLAHNYAYYGANDSRGDDLRPGAMVAEACQWAYSQGVDFSKYDWDGDGEVEEVFVLYAGKGEADDGLDYNIATDEEKLAAANLIWPHMFYLSEGDYGKALELGGVKIDTYACSAELNGTDNLDGIGTFCHEFSHCMGFPDLYNTYYNNDSWFGMGDFDLMCSGSYNGEGRCPAGYSAYEKAVCGWINLTDLTDIEEAQTVTGLKPTSEGGAAYIISNNAHKDEYYIIENRQPRAWDAELPGDGVMIMYVDFDQYVWNWNVPNSYQGEYYVGNTLHQNDHQRMTIFRASNPTYKKDDLNYKYGDARDLYPYGSNNSLTASSKPASTLYNKNEDGTKYMHIDIKDIAVASDGTASMTFSPADRSEDPDAPVTPVGDVLLYESFDKCKGTGGNDGNFKGSIASAKAAAENFDNAGWSSTGTIYAADGCVRLGISGTPGNITTPAFVVAGSAYLSFKVAGWDSSKDATSLSLSVNNGTLSKYSVPVKAGAWSTFGATISANGNVKLTFTANKGRFFLDEVKIVNPSIDGIEETEMGHGNNAVVGYYSLDGTRLAGPKPGVCLVKMANGEVHKVLIRK